MQSAAYEWLSQNETQTQALGAAFAKGYLSNALKAKEHDQDYALLIDLRGPLGAGKTCFSKSVASACGIKSLRSPTFTICQRYDFDLEAGKASSKTHLFHLDTYRIEDPSEMLLHGWDEMNENGLVLVEWAERIEEILPEQRICLSWEHISPSERKIFASADGEREVALLKTINETVKG